MCRSPWLVARCCECEARSTKKRAKPRHCELGEAAVGVVSTVQNRHDPNCQQLQCQRWPVASGLSRKRSHSWLRVTPPGLCHLGPLKQTLYTRHERPWELNHSPMQSAAWRHASHPSENVLKV